MRGMIRMLEREEGVCLGRKKAIDERAWPIHPECDIRSQYDIVWWDMACDACVVPVTPPTSRELALGHPVYFTDNCDTQDSIAR